MLSFTLSGNISMDNHQWRLSQAHTYAYSYNFNYLSITYTLPIACQSLSVHILCLWHIFYLYFSVFLYLSCVHLSRLSYVFSLFLFFFMLHIMSLVYVFFIFRFYDLLYSMYYLIFRISRRSIRLIPLLSYHILSYVFT